MWCGWPVSTTLDLAWLWTWRELYPATSWLLWSLPIRLLCLCQRNGSRILLHGQLPRAILRCCLYGCLPIWQHHPAVPLGVWPGALQPHLSQPGANTSSLRQSEWHLELCRRSCGSGRIQLCAAGWLWRTQTHVEGLRWKRALCSTTSAPAMWARNHLRWVFGSRSQLQHQLQGSIWGQPKHHGQVSESQYPTTSTTWLGSARLFVSLPWDGSVRESPAQKLYLRRIPSGLRGGGSGNGCRGMSCPTAELPGLLALFGVPDATAMRGARGGQLSDRCWELQCSVPWGVLYHVMSGRLCWRRSHWQMPTGEHQLRTTDPWLW